jgi:Zn-dependent M28 family amino/carboxypeptidase
LQKKKNEQNDFMSFKKYTIAVAALLFIACACTKKAATTAATAEYTYRQVSPAFNADSAYQYVARQVEFGPRVPDTKEHKACGDYLVAQLKRFGANVSEQISTVKTYDGTKVKSRNIIASYSPEKETRVLIFAHWDTRPFADHDPDPSKRNTPILGANDGASGVGVLLEVARVLKSKPADVGVDIIFFDVEDWGDPETAKDVPPGDWWCLGTQYWAKNPHKEGYKARYGILLDMVGAPDATFFKEGFSMQYAADVVEKIWSNARLLGYGKYFIDATGGTITDDHVPVNQIAGIPSVDIIHQDKNSQTGFGWYWHTTKDNMDNVSKETLKAVGQTIMEVVYKEK